MLDHLLALLVPPRCAACRAPLARAGDPLCAGCRAGLPWLRGRRCERCGLPGGCGARCPSARSAVARAWAPLAHAGPARALVHALKFGGALPLAQLMAAQVAANAPAELLAPRVFLVPVPAHPSRRRRRGFDHAALLASALGARGGVPVASCLAREGSSATRQLGASRAVRLREGRIAVRALRAAPAHAVLVDDVHTTGATLDACARALRAAGAQRVDALTYARAL
ncbi:MAG TPA: ComF family protein [Baekduia sp.]|nr:ComF family protein [Baekduia sp.]